MDSFSIVCGEAQTITRTIKEAMFITANDLSLNWILGVFGSPIYGISSFKTPLLSSLRRPDTIKF